MVKLVDSISLGSFQLRLILSNLNRNFPKFLNTILLYVCIYQQQHFNEATLGLICGQLRSSDIPQGHQRSSNMEHFSKNKK